MVQVTADFFFSFFIKSGNEEGRANKHALFEVICKIWKSSGFLGHNCILQGLNDVVYIFIHRVFLGGGSQGIRIINEGECRGCIVPPSIEYSILCS